jgi:hypothetical protein
MLYVQLNLAFYPLYTLSDVVLNQAKVWKVTPPWLFNGSARLQIKGTGALSVVLEIVISRARVSPKIQRKQSNINERLLSKMMPKLNFCLELFTLMRHVITPGRRGCIT